MATWVEFTPSGTGHPGTANAFNPEQPREPDGKFGSGGAPSGVKPPRVGLLGKLKSAVGKLFGGSKRTAHAIEKVTGLSKLEAKFHEGQLLAKAVAKERGHSDEHVERVGRVLAVADAAARWTQWLPVHGALDMVGGPIAGTVGAKASYYFPTASMAYVALAMAHHAAEGRDPADLIRRARERVATVGPIPDRPATTMEKMMRSTGGVAQERRGTRLGGPEQLSRNMQTIAGTLSVTANMRRIACRR